MTTIHPQPSVTAESCVIGIDPYSVAGFEASVCSVLTGRHPAQVADRPIEFCTAGRTRPGDASISTLFRSEILDAFPEKLIVEAFRFGVISPASTPHFIASGSEGRRATGDDAVVSQKAESSDPRRTSID